MGKTIRSMGIMLLNLCICISLIGSPAYAKNKAKDQSKEEDEVIVVSLGDSYSAGEGIEPFYGQGLAIKDKVLNEDWLAHRSEKSWPGQLTVPGLEGTLADHKGKNWFFAAASGAVTADLIRGQEKKYNKGGYKGKKSLPSQLSVFKKIGNRQVDYVTLTFGGNDVGFEGIVQDSVTDTTSNLGASLSGNPFLDPNNLSTRLNETWAEFGKTTKYNIRDAYIDIRRDAGAEAEIIVAGYPKLFEEDNGPFLWKWNEKAKIVNESVHRFNRALREIVASCQRSGMKIHFVSVEEAFEGHGAYAQESYINGLMATQFEDLDDWKQPPISSYSIHPNEEGAQAYAACVQECIDKIEEEKAQRGQEKEEERNFADNPLATEEEMAANALHYKGFSLKPEAVVLKLFDSLQTGNYQRAASCLDPKTEGLINIVGMFASKIYEVFTGENLSWGEILLKEAGATDVDVIECYTLNYRMRSKDGFYYRWIPVIPGVQDVLSTEADVHVKYRYKYKGEYRTDTEICHVQRYAMAGWRIDVYTP